MATATIARQECIGMDPERVVVTVVIVPTGIATIVPRANMNIRYKRSCAAAIVRLHYEFRARPPHLPVFCKFAGNSDPLRGIIASNSDPF